MATRILLERYKTYEGARKRAAFENGVAPSEFKNGYKARLYHYTVIQAGDQWRVQRSPRDLDAMGDDNVCDL